MSYLIIGLNVVVYALQLQFPKLIELGGMLSGSFLSSVDGEVLRGVADGGYWRLVTSAFLHGGFIHMVLNAVGLYFFGPFVERALGRLWFTVTYLVAATVASVFVYWLSPVDALTVGASGAVFALFGIALIFLWQSKQSVGPLLIMLAINAVLSLQSGISWQGHLGGFVAGILIGSAIAFVPAPKRRTALLGTLAVLVVGSAVAVAIRTQQLSHLIS